MLLNYNQKIVEPNPCVESLPEKLFRRCVTLRAINDGARRYG